MSVDVRQPFAEFLYSCFCEYRATLPPNTSIAGKLWREKVAEWHERWHDARKPRRQPKVVSAEAEAIFALYPRKVGKQAALRAIVKALGKIPGDVLSERVRTFASIVGRWREADHAFIPHPSTWFNEGRFDDDPNEWNRPGMSAPPEQKIALAPIPEPEGWREYVKREWSPNSYLYDDASCGTPWNKLTRGTQEALHTSLSVP